MDIPPVPPHPLEALTPYELSRYRRQLEHALTITRTARRPTTRNLRDNTRRPALMLPGATR